MASFAKHPKDAQSLVTVLMSRGMSIPNHDLARHFIQYVGYYRLSGYGLLLEEPGSMITTSGVSLYQRTHQFKPGTTFEDIKALYEIDRSLRLSLFGAIGQIEVALRNEMCNYMAIKYGDPHWYLDIQHFNSGFLTPHSHKNRSSKSQYKTFIERVKAETGQNNPNRRTTFCSSYYTRYSSPDLPPIWMIAEQLSMGTWSKVYEGLELRQDKKAVCNCFDASPMYFASWLRALSYLRNLCAHHMRIIGINFVNTPAASNRITVPINNADFAMFVAVIHLLLKKVQPNNNWALEIHSLLQATSPIPIETELGFPVNWQTNSFWQ